MLTNATPATPAAPVAALNLRDLDIDGAAGKLAARLYSASEPVRKPASKHARLIVVFHAGGFVGGDVDEADAFLRRLVLACPQQIVLAARYTLAPERPFPAAVEDAHAVLVWAKKNKAKLGWSGTQLVVAGIEAGANLAAVAALMARDRGGPALDGQILIMPMLDPCLSSGSMRDKSACPEMATVATACAAGYRRYLPNAIDRSHPYASPLQSSRLKNLPPALILSCESDPLRDEAEQYGAKLLACHIPTTLQRLPLPATPLRESGSRNEFAGQTEVQRAILAFLNSL